MVACPGSRSALKSPPPTRPPAGGVLRRRSFLAGLVSVVAMPVVAEGQPAGKVARIGFLGPSISGDDRRVENFRRFREGLRELGYIEGKTITIEWRLADKYELYPALAAELVRLNVDVLVTPNTPGALILKQTTTSIPIVFTAVAVPVGTE